MIRVIIELQLVFPYKKYIGILSEFCSLWQTRILSGGTKRIKAIISMPVNKFKIIFGENPIIKTYNVPSGMEKFIESLKVKDIVVK